MTEKFINDVKKYQIATSKGFSLYTVIPKNVRERLELKEGDYVMVLIKKVSFDEMSREAFE